MSIASHRLVARISVSLLWIWLGVAAACGQPPTKSDIDGAAEAESSAAVVRARRPTLDLPATLADGRPLHAIGLYQSQIDELIPPSYHPVRIGKFREALLRQSDRANSDQASRLKGAVYWVRVVGDTLVSERSVIDIESDSASIVRSRLGRVNLAIKQPPARGTSTAGDVLPRLESDKDGNLVAVFRGDARTGSGIEFEWQLRGQVSGAGYDFEMELPRTPQTRVVLSAPADLTINSLDGVLRRRPGPPPDANRLLADRELRWYELDAGGLERVRLRTRPARPQHQEEGLIVRRSTVRCEADVAGLVWSSDMVVQIPRHRGLPTIAVSGTTITSAKVNNIEVPFTSRLIGGRGRHVELEVAESILATFAGDIRDVAQLDDAADTRRDSQDNVVRDASRRAVYVTLTGRSRWSEQNGWCELPMPTWIGKSIVHASAVDGFELRVRDPLQVISWRLPPDWKQAEPRVLDDGITLYAADGPATSLLAKPPTSPKATTASERAGNGNRAGAKRTPPPRVGTWSRVRFIRRPIFKSTQTALRLEPAPGSLSAKARITLQRDSDRIEPVELRVEPGWSLDSVAFASSGRIIESPNLNEKSRVLSLWPEAEDARGDEIVVEATGTSVLPTAVAVIPATWFVRPVGVRGEMIAAIAPPPDLNWSGEAVMQRGRIDPAELSEDQKQFFRGLDQDALWFQPEMGRVPTLSLLTPSVSFNVQTVLRVVRDRDELAETLEIEVASQGQTLKQLDVQTGPPGDRPPMTWSISGSDDTPSVSLPPSDVVMGKDAGTYTIDIGDNLRGRRLIGKRRYPIEQEFQLPLPSVPGAASQSSDVLVGPGLLVQDRSSAVQLVPFTGTAAEADRAAADAGHVESQVTRLRYDAVQLPSISLRKSDDDPSVTIVWRAQVRVTASSRGTDRVEALLDVSPTAPLEIEYDPELQLASVSRDGRSIDLMTIRQRPTIVLLPQGKTESIRIVWNRSQFGSSWLRRCRMPRISISGTILKTEYRLIASADTFAPAALLRGRFIGRGRISQVEMRPGEGAILVRRNVALAVGWLVALLVFAISWYAAGRAPVMVAAAVALMTTSLFLWWPWRLALIGWLIVPLVAAAMLATSRAWGGEGSGTPRVEPPDRSGSTRSMARDLSADFSLSAMSRFMLLLVTSVWATALSWARDDPPAASSNNTQSVNILVPLDHRGELSGTMIYIPRSLYDQLFPAAAEIQPQDPRFESAAYQVKIEPVANVNRLAVASIEAEYLIHLDAGDPNQHPVRLPLAPAFIRRIELLGDDTTSIIRFQAETRGGVIAMFPRGDAFRIRVTLMPDISTHAEWTRLVVPIPRIASSRLIIESVQSMDALRVGGARGRLLEETDLRLWTDELGPEESLEIDFRTLAQANMARTRPLERRYWINAGKRHVTIDCEVQPPTEMVAGESFQFVVRDSALPTVTSSSWRLDRSEQYSATRRLMTITSTHDSPGPIGLLWTQQASPSPGSPLSIQIPEVIAAALGENAPAWVALHCDSALQFAPPSRVEEPLSVDHFLAAWSGYGDAIDRAYVAVGEMPTPVVELKAGATRSASVRHHLHVMPDQLELHYTATLNRADRNSTRHTLRLSRGLELVHLSVNDRELNSQLIPTGRLHDVSLGNFGDSDTVTIKAVATLRLPSNMQFTPPRLTLVPIVPTSHVYTISRDRSTTLREVRPPSIAPIDSSQVATADSLAKGWIPVSTWSMQSSDEATPVKMPDARYQVKTRPTRYRFDASQLIVLNRDEGQWKSETFVRFKPGQIPDYVDIEMPTRWCDSLEVGPTHAFSRQPANDPSRQIIRVLCDPDELKDQTLSIRGQLENNESTRVSAPSIRVLGFGGRQTHVSVPTRLPNAGPIQWRTSAVEAVKPPSSWKELVPEQGRATYFAANPSWSIDLAPLSEIDAAAIAVNCDAQVFAQDSGALVFCRWDLFPGGRNSVDLRLPPGAMCLGAWSAGRAVVAETFSDPDQVDGTQNATLCRIPLSLSRLSQPVELLIGVSASAGKRSRYLPELIGIPVTQQWLTNYVPTDSGAGTDDNNTALYSDRAFALARAVVEAIEAVASVDRRPRDEVAAWLDPWLARYQRIADSVGRQFDINAPINRLDIDDVALVQASSGEAEADAASPLRWSDLDLRIARYVRRFRGDDPSSRTRASFPSSHAAFDFGIGGFEGFQPHRITLLTAADRPPAVQPASSSDRGLRNLMTSGLTLLLVCGFLVCLRPIQHFAVPIVAHPAFWLALMGMFGFAVAPYGVAAAILLVALVFAAFPAGKSRVSDKSALRSR